eukprot:1579898-Rhodomonas_salina.1
MLNTKRGAELGYGTTSVLCDVRYDLAYGAMRCPRMSGTDLAYRTICLRGCYAMSGTDVAYGARTGFETPFSDPPQRPPSHPPPQGPVSSYALATRCP